MIKSSKRLIAVVSLIILVSLACNVPILDQVQTILAPADDTGSTSSTSGTSTDSTAPSNTDGAELTFIPGATFQMGSAASDLLAEVDEIPQHQVTLGEFYIYTYEVTNQMYTACVDTGGCMSVETFDVGPTSHFEDPDFEEFPVVGVDWVMARDYCSWAGSRLPTEAEWELASRGPESLLYPWGEEEPSCDYVNMGGCLIPPDTQQVGHYLLGNSPDEVWDMSGNVWEWVHDWYADDYYAQSPADNPIGPLEPQDPDKPLRVIRGGGLYSEPDRMRSASRLGINPYRPFDDVGFRCVVGEGLALPAAYDPGEDRHERVPPGRADGGDRAEDDPDDEIVYWSSDAIGPCPDFEGRIRLRFNVGSRPPTDGIAAFFRFADDPFDIPCDYNEALGVATCEGLAPPDYLDPPPTFPLDICFATPEWERCIFGVPVLKPTDCFDDASWLTVDIRSGCADTVPPAAIAIRIVPPDAPFESASANSIPLDCDPLPDEDGYYICSGLPGSPGEELDIDVFFADGMTRSGTIDHPVCDGPVDFVDPFALAQVGCQGESEYYAVIDTFITDEIASWRLEGVEAPLGCGPADPPRPGRFYCNFAIRGWYTTLTFCVEIVGRPGEICETFAEEDFGMSLPASCSDPDDDDPGDDGGDDDSTCSPYNETECTTIHSNECMWTNGACTDR